MGHALKDTLHDHNKYASEIIYPTVLPSALFTEPEKGRSAPEFVMNPNCEYCVS
jgi:hypothetical protein